MTVNELYIMEFGGLSDRRYELSHGLNIFEGENEAGKSTLWLFIKFMLYGMPKKGHPERQRSVSRTSHIASGTMTVTKDGQSYRIERSFSENSREKVTVFRLSDGERVFEGENVGERLLGVSREIFENSVGIGQNACTSLGGEKGAAAIRNILCSADEDVDIERIQKKLDSIRVFYRHRNGKGGRLYELSEEINGLERRLDKAVEDRLKISDTEKRLVLSDKNIKAAEAELDRLSAITERLKRFEILSRFERLADKRCELKDKEAELSELIKNSAVGEYIPTAADATSLMALATSCQRAERALNDAENILMGIEESKPADTPLTDLGRLWAKDGGEAVLSSYKRARMQRTAGFCTVAISALLCALTAVLIFISPIFAVIPAVCLAVTIVGLLVALSGISALKRGIMSSLPKGKSADEYIKECISAYEARTKYEAAFYKAGSDRESADGHLLRIFSDMACEMERLCPDTEVSAENAQKEAWRIHGFAEKRRQLSDAISSIEGFIEGEEKILSVYDEATLRKASEANGSPLLSLAEVEHKKRFCEDRLKLLRQKDSDLRTELINLKAHCDDPTALRDTLLDKRRQLEHDEEYYEAVVLAMDNLDRAASAMRGNITPAIGRTAGEIISELCGGRYEGITLGKSMDICLVDKNGMSTTVDMMSGGMRDAAYIALRISLMLRIFGSELPPLMMDEALCQLDDKRMRHILRILERLCGMGAQCLLFTCHTREVLACRDMGIAARTFRM